VQQKIELLVRPAAAVEFAKGVDVSCQRRVWSQKLASGDTGVLQDPILVRSQYAWVREEVVRAHRARSSEEARRSISSRMLPTDHAVIRGPILTGFGNLPSRHPCHQLDLLIGKMARIEGSRTKPVSGRSIRFGTGISSCYG
jgi:hypothetical protein